MPEVDSQVVLWGPQDPGLPPFCTVTVSRTERLKQGWKTDELNLYLIVTN